MHQVILNERDGKLSVHPEGILLFADASRASNGTPSSSLNTQCLKVRFAEFRCYEMTAKDVMGAKHENVVFSLWKKKREEEEKSRKAKLSLRAVDEEAVRPVLLFIYGLMY